VQVEHPRQATGLEDEKRSRNRELDPQLIWRGKDRQDSAILNMKFVGLPDLSGQIFEQFLGAHLRKKKGESRILNSSVYATSIRRLSRRLTP
jgi:hypothetical protein